MRVVLLALTGLALAAGGCAKSGEEPAAVEKSGDAAVKPAGEAALGRVAFVEKGCVLCHSVNGVGGKAAPALDAADDFVQPDPLEFAARIWRGAPAMVEFQSVELGYVIDLTGNDIANLAAFAASRDAQKALTDADIPEAMRDSLLDERYWEMEDWSEFMADGQEGMGDPPAPGDAASDAPASTEPQPPQ